MRKQRQHFRVSAKQGLIAGTALGLVAVVADQFCARFKEQNARVPEAISDAVAHLTTGLAIALPASAYVREPERFLAVAGVSAVFIDLDHVVAARSIKLDPCMTMPKRPATHSVLAVGGLAYVAERVEPGRQTELAVTLGLGSHLLRDLITGGAPLFMPSHIVEIARHRGLFMMMGTAAIGRWYARRLLDPDRARRSNPVVLAPEALVAGARAVRANRNSGRAA
ncbi:MAG: metal-dependent hydrolase [Thermomicrobiales bacterium]